MENRHVPFLDLITPHCELEEEFVAVFRDALRTGSFIGGPAVENFEKDFARFCDSKYCVGVGSGTDALRFALIAAGIKQGDIVITVPNTFIATAEAVSQAGADPAFIDIDEKTYNMDPAKLGEFLSKECKAETGSGRTIHSKSGRPVTAVIPVHLYGQIADMDRIRELAEQHNVIVIEDACQAHGAEYFSKKDKTWKKAGSMGKAAAFSFYPGKNLGACGEAGAVTTNDEEIARKVRMLREHGQVKKYIHDIEGYNGRLDAIQAGILNIKLINLQAWNEKRRQVACRYSELLGPIKDIILPHEPRWAKSVYHLYVVRVPKRNELQAFLANNSIFTGLHYPIPLHLQHAYTNLGYTHGDLPVAEKMSLEILSLPMFPGLTEGQQLHVAEQVRKFVVSTKPVGEPLSR